MCTILLLRRSGHPWPLLAAANRDERIDRAWDPPGAHWPPHPATIGGRDRSAGGTWMALGASGILAAVLNRPGSLGPAAGKLSRGDLPLRAAGAASAAAAARDLAGLDTTAYRPFNLVLADRDSAFFLRGLGEGPVEVMPLDEGFTMVTAQDPNDPTSPRIRRHLPRFRAAPPPRPDQDDWSDWESLLADDSQGEAGIAETLRVPPTKGFGTVCSSLVGLSADGARHWRFCAGPPGTLPFQDLPLPAP